MLKKVENYSVSKWNQFLERLLHKSRRLTESGLCTISFTGNELLISSAKRNQEQKITIDFCESYPCTREQIKSVLSNIVKKKQLKMKDCVWILQPDEYQFLTIDLLPVPDSEFQEAIRWKIKELINYPIDDVVVDRFSIPKSGDTTSKMMIVVAKASYLLSASEKINASGLDLSVIDIPELTLRNITALYEEDGKTTAVLYMQDNVVELLITAQKQLYFTRRLTVDLNIFTKKNNSTENNTDFISNKLRSLEKIAMDIQRSLDYCQSQWRFSMPERFLLISTFAWSEEEIIYLSQRTNMTLVRLNLENKILFNKNLNEIQQAKYILNIGAILRTES